MTSLLMVVVAAWVLLSALAALGFCVLLTGARLADEARGEPAAPRPRPRDGDTALTPAAV